MLEDMLIPEAKLVAHDTFVNANARHAVANLAVDLENGTYGRAFKNFLLLSYWPSLLGNPRPSREALFYNKYFWFLKFVRLSGLSHGYDAGAHQQAFQMLEQAEFDVDCGLIEEIETRVERELPTK